MVNHHVQLVSFKLGPTEKSSAIDFEPVANIPTAKDAIP